MIGSVPVHRRGAQGASRPRKDRVHLVIATTYEPRPTPADHRASLKEARHARSSPARPSRPGPAQAPGEGSAPRHPRGDPDAIAELREHHPEPIDPASASSPTRSSCSRAATRRRAGRVSCSRVPAHRRDLARRHRRGARPRHATTRNLLHEEALVRRTATGARRCRTPRTSAATGSSAMLHELGARTSSTRIDRAALQSKVETARAAVRLMGRPPLPDGALGGPAYTLSAPGTAFLLGLGARVVRRARASGSRRSTSCSRPTAASPQAKHAILELYVAARGRAARHADDGAASRPDRSARGASASRSGTARAAPSRTRRSTRRRSAATTRSHATHGHAARRHDAAAHVRGLRRDRDRAVAARARHGRRTRAAEVDATGSAATRRCSATVVSQPNFWMNHWQRPMRRGSRSCCWTTAPIRTRARRSGSGCIPDTATTSCTSTATSRRCTYGARFSNRLFVNKRAMELILLNGGTVRRRPGLTRRGRATW